METKQGGTKAEQDPVETGTVPGPQGPRMANIRTGITKTLQEPRGS